MGDELMAKEIEVDPIMGTAAFGATEQRAVEASRGGEFVHGNRKVERCEHA
jgi:hypothetical protein